MHVHAHSHTSGKKLIWTILFNIVITVAEFIGGIMTGYLALVADAVHNLSDVAALGLAWLGVKGSELPATKKTTYGYKRVEVISAFISAVALVVIAIFILIEAYGRFVNPQPLTNPGIFLTVAVIGFLGNIFSIWMLHSEKGKSLNMKTAFLHMLYDALSSGVVIIGGIIILFTDWFIIDSILSAAISLMIFWSSYLVIKEAVLIFLEAVPQNIAFDDVYQAIKNVPKVEDVHDLHIWSLSSKDIAFSCHVCVKEEDLNISPQLTETINRMLANNFDICHGTIQVETKACHDDQLVCGSNQIPTPNESETTH